MAFYTEIALLFSGAILRETVQRIFKRYDRYSFEYQMKKKFGNKSNRNISGYWVTQYQYPSFKKNKLSIKTETQIVYLKQKGRKIVGHTVESNKHPEIFEGDITHERYFTGRYMNTLNHHNYHGSFQFILSNSKGVMQGKWIGFNDDGNGINKGDWRWLQTSHSSKENQTDLHQAKERSNTINLFDDDFSL